MNGIIGKFRHNSSCTEVQGLTNTITKAVYYLLLSGQHNGADDVHYAVGLPDVRLSHSSNLATFVGLRHHLAVHFRHKDVPTNSWYSMLAVVTMQSWS